jgi:gas vesicle protein
MAERNDLGAFLIGFVVGGLTGAAVSLLMAPQSGDDTREFLRERAIELRDKASETAQVTAEQVNTTAEQVRVRATELADKAKVNAEDLQHRGQVVAEDLQHRGQVIIEEQRAKINDTVQSMRKGKDEGASSEAA